MLLAGALMAASAAAQQSAPGSIMELPELSGAGGAGRESDEPVSGVSDEQVQDLIATLEDPARRQELIDTLQALLAARPEADTAEPATPDDYLAPVLQVISSRVQVVGHVAISIADSLDQIPSLLSWLRDQLLDPNRRLIWRDVAAQVGLILGLGGLGYLGASLALRRPKERLTHPPQPAAASWRLPRLLAWLVLLLLELLALVAAVMAAAAMIQPSALVHEVMLTLLQGVVRAGLSIIAAQVLLAPGAGAIRLVPLGDDAAAYAFRAVRLIAATAIIGYFSLKAARWLGLPWAIHGFLSHLLFLVVLGMAIAVVLRCRRPVGDAIAGLGGESHSGALRSLPWRGLAGIWHLLAMAYLVLAYLAWALRIPSGFQILLWGTIGTAVAVLVGWGLLGLVDGLFRDKPAASEDDGGMAQPTQRRAVRYLPVVRILLRTAVVALIALALLEIWGLGVVEWLGSDAGQIFGGKLVTILLVVVVTVALWEVASVTIERSISETDAQGNLRLSNRARTLLVIARNFLLVFLGTIGLFLILSELGLDIAPLLAGAGVVGLAIGFGSQKLVQDIINGMFVLLADTIRVGDIVEVAGRGGSVEKVTMRTVVLRDYNGTVYTIPFSSIDTVSNLTKEFSYALFDIRVAYRESVDQVMEVMREIGQEMNRDPYFRRLILEPLELAGVDRFEESAVVVKGRLKTRPIKQWEVGREYNRRLKNRFDELGIEIALPHRRVYFGADKQGEAPPVRVRMQDADQSEAGPQPEPRSDTPAEPEPAVARARRG